MPVSVTMPRLGESVTEGTVTRWLKQEGDTVEADEPLLEVSTDKVDTEIPSPAAGVLTRIVVREDETAEVGSELAVIDGDGGGSSGGEAAAAPAQEESTESSESEEAAPAQESAQDEPPLAEEQEAHDESEEQSAETTAPSSSSSASSSGGGGGGGGGTVVTMPALGESVTEGTVTRWLKEVGQTVEADEPLLEVSTDKVDTEIPSPTAGTVLEIKVAQDETAAVGAELAVIGAADGGGGGDATPQQEAASAGARPSRRRPSRKPSRSPRRSRKRRSSRSRRPLPPPPRSRRRAGAPSRRRPRATTAVAATSPRWCANSRRRTTST